MTSDKHSKEKVGNLENNYLEIKKKINKDLVNISYQHEQGKLKVIIELRINVKSIILSLKKVNNDTVALKSLDVKVCGGWSDWKDL